MHFFRVKTLNTSSQKLENMMTPINSREHTISDNKYIVKYINWMKYILVHLNSFIITITITYYNSTHVHTHLSIRLGLYFPV